MALNLKAEKYRSLMVKTEYQVQIVSNRKGTK